jgi:phosphoketolase
VTQTTAQRHTLTEGEAQTLDSYWRAANYLAVGQIYLMDNPLLAEPLRLQRAVHHGPAGDLRLPRVPVADPTG